MSDLHLIKMHMHIQSYFQHQGFEDPRTQDKNPCPHAEQEEPGDLAQKFSEWSYFSEVSPSQKDVQPAL